jgi:preprotein translocase subunit YajC
MLRFGLVAGLLIAIALLGGCLPAQAPPEGGQQGFDWSLIIFLVLIFVVFYFLMIRPQRRRQKEMQTMLRELQKGDKIVTAGGIYGEIESIDETTVLMKVESGATMRVAKSSVLGRQAKQ